ncbi:helix-hairpin-helix domain-containing protein [Caloramator sp. mosi_1]|nr:SLBB domain-containing protein [Caloramator sp. mosi_1]WDC83886.1 helix-hairpin-helix domain-containing protein [Caloramator sp. mosi_1]
MYICGEVKRPGVYKIDDDKRLIDLIYIAGGFTENANSEAVNLAIKLKDEDYIRIPAKGIKNGNGEVVLSNINENKININKATIEELKKLPRIGDSLARRIIEYREKMDNLKE